MNDRREVCMYTSVHIYKCAYIQVCIYTSVQVFNIHVRDWEVKREWAIRSGLYILLWKTLLYTYAYDIWGISNICICMTHVCELRFTCSNTKIHIVYYNNIHYIYTIYNFQLNTTCLSYINMCTCIHIYQESI